MNVAVKILELTIQHPVLKTLPRKSSREQKNATLVLHKAF